jgi:3-isopropylmalate/(R)-2-methylmalate dehydratase small subunit
MEPVRSITGRALPLDRSDVDTDQIIPSEWLKRIERTGFGAGLFAEWRDDRNFVLNQPEYAGATILIAGPSFGIGSSREHAVWALHDYGFKAVISPKFGDIFRNNSTRSGLVPVVVTPEVDRALLDAVTKDPSLEITIDVERRSVEAPAIGLTSSFELDDDARQRLIGGLDDIGVTLAFSDEITDFESKRSGVLLPTTRA